MRVPAEIREISIDPELTLYRSRGVSFRSGSKFLKDWMSFLEENADLRYPDLDDLLRDE